MAAPIKTYICFHLNKLRQTYRCFSRVNTHTKCIGYREFSSDQGGEDAKKQLFMEDKRDPYSIFLEPQVQKILKKVSGMELETVFSSKYTDTDVPPDYRILTDEQFKEERDKSRETALEYLQMPPVLPPRDETTKQVISDDSRIARFEDGRNVGNNYVFTDITYSVPHRERTIVVRQPDGMLRHALPNERDRIIQTYFTKEGRHIHMPEMFEPFELEKMLHEGRQGHAYILHRACIQFEPNDPEFIRITHSVYEHVLKVEAFDALRSSRFFGPMAFYCVQTSQLDALLMDMLKRDMLSDAEDMVRLFAIFHTDSGIALAMHTQKITGPIPLLHAYIKTEAIKTEELKLAVALYEQSERQESNYMLHS